MSVGGWQRAAAGLARVPANVAGEAGQFGPDPMGEQGTPGRLRPLLIADVSTERAILDTADGPLGGLSKPGGELGEAFDQGALVESVGRGAEPIMPEVRRVDQRGPSLQGGREP